jgi:hypothetical protein
MPEPSPARPLYAPNYTGPRFFGAPVGDFSVLQSLLITGATGLASFFASTFVAIMAILFLNEALHRQIDFADSYKWVGLPIGIAMLCAAAVYLGTLVVMRWRREGGRK